MDETQIESILQRFFKTTVLQLNGEGNITKVIFNSKEDFKPKRGMNIVDLFCVADRERIESLLDSTAQDSKKYLKLASALKVKEYADVEVYSEGRNVYVALKFFESERERELLFDKKIEKFTELAEIDPLTSLLNRYGYWERVKMLLNCGDSDRMLGILVVDVDKLKEVNDTKGHKAGDKALRAISSFIAECLRRRDVAVRYGGDEFVIVVEELTGSKSTGEGLAKRLVREISTNPQKFLTTVSIGVHIVRVGDFEPYLKNEERLRKEWDKSVEVADEMAYEAKESGRNRSVFSRDKVKLS